MEANVGVGRRLPSFSVVVECENVRSGGLDRLRRMLQLLSEQIDEMKPSLVNPPELVMLHEADIDSAFLRRVVEECFAARKYIQVRVIKTEGLTYYTQKNFGAARARNEVIIFLDSDVLPEDGWLRNLIEPFYDPNVEIVYGNCYIDPINLYSKAFALFWFFPLRTNSEECRPDELFFVNNTAFRRELFLTYKFPELPTQRRQCAALSREMRRDGHRIYLQCRSRVAHPAPDHFLRRALAHGHDYLFYPGPSDPRKSAWMHVLQGAWHLTRRSTARIRHHYRDVGLSAPGAVAALGIAVTYYTLFLIGGLVAGVRPEIVRRHCRI